MNLLRPTSLLLLEKPLLLPIAGTATLRIVGATHHRVPGAVGGDSGATCAKAIG